MVSLIGLHKLKIGALFPFFKVPKLPHSHSTAQFWDGLETLVTKALHIFLKVNKHLSECERESKYGLLDFVVNTEDHMMAQCHWDIIICMHFVSSSL